MPNAFALLVLVAWPGISVILFRRLPAGRALIASILVAYLFLPPPPAGFDFPLLPPLQKETIPSIVALILCLVLYRDRMRFLPESRIGRALVLAYLLSPLGTVLTNGDPVFWGHIGVPALRLRDAVALLVQQGLLLTPLLLAQGLLRDTRDQRDILLALCLGGLVYSLPMLLEVRLSPQLNIWIYGYFQHSFEQMMRMGGFRPIVFLYHGLWVAFFAMTAVLSAVALARAEPPRRAIAFWAAAAYLFVVLVLCKSAASLLYAVAFAPLVAFLGARMQMRIAVLICALAVVYPLMKGAGLVPQERMLSVAEGIDAERAASLRFRFENEDVLLDRAYHRPVFGWGTWGRNQIMDPSSGRILTVSDGRWVIVIGMFGWVGFLAEMGLLILPVILMWRRSVGLSPEEIGPWIGPLALLLAINVADLIPNATITPLTWLIAGAILGRAESRARVQQTEPAQRMQSIRTVL